MWLMMMSFNSAKRTEHSLVYQICIIYMCLHIFESTKLSSKHHTNSLEYVNFVCDSFHKLIVFFKKRLL